MIIEQVNDDVVITKGEYTFTLIDFTLFEVLDLHFVNFYGFSSNEDRFVYLDLSNFEYESLMDQIRKQL